MTTNEIIQWHNCYDDSWKDLITPESFSHPAKYSRGLIQRIYQYCLEKQYFTEGMCILDPFGGIGLGAIATHYGLNWLGNELEPRFCQMAWSWDCPGIKQEDYDGYKGQCESPQDWYKLDLGCCSECVYKAIEGEQPQPGLFEQEGYFTDPHRYHGNLERFKRYAQDGTWAKLTQGDSRKLNEIWAEGLVSSPPYAKSLRPMPGNRESKAKRHAKGEFEAQRPDVYSSKSNIGAAGMFNPDYGSTDGQLANMPEGLVSSPPYASLGVGNHGEGPGAAGNEAQRKRIAQGNRGEKAAKAIGVGYGSEDGNLGGMSEGLVSSPPFAGNTGGKGKASRDGIDAALLDRHSGGMVGGMHGTEGNLEGMQPGGLVSSPPFAGVHKKFDAEANARQVTSERAKKVNDYGSTDGQLANMPEGLVSSPPFASSVGSDDPQRRGGILKSDPKRKGDKSLTGDYGDSEGQLAAMESGLVSSPPYETGGHHKHQMDAWNKNEGGQGGHGLGYADESEEQVGGPTFWSAAADIVSCYYNLLPSGAIAVFITKNYIKSGKEVDFTSNWQQLCISCGFEMVEEIRAMLVKNLGIQLDSFGNAAKIISERKSFFRRNYENNARAAKHWKTLSKQDQVGLIMKSYINLLLDYIDKLSRKEDDVASIILPTKSRTISRAKKIGWVRDGKIRYDIDTAIDYETVTIMRRI